MVLYKVSFGKVVKAMENHMQSNDSEKLQTATLYDDETKNSINPAANNQNVSLQKGYFDLSSPTFKEEQDELQEGNGSYLSQGLHLNTELDKHLSPMQSKHRQKEQVSAYEDENWASKSPEMHSQSEYNNKQAVETELRQITDCKVTDGESNKSELGKQIKYIEEKAMVDSIAGMGGDYAIKSVETKSKLKVQKKKSTSDKISDKNTSMNQDIINQI